MNPLILEGDLTIVNDDHYVCAGDVVVNGNVLAAAIVSELGIKYDRNRDAGAMGWGGNVLARVRVTVERLDQ